MASKIRAILVAMKAALQTINGAGSYTYNLSDTDQVMIGRPRPEFSRFPCAWINVNDLVLVPGDALINMKRTLNIEVEARVQASAQTGEERGLAAADLLNDLVIALESDQSLGGLVYNMEFSGTSLDGDEVGMSTCGIAYAQVKLEWEQRRGTGI